jgi:DNA topoisomerase-1
MDLPKSKLGVDSDHNFEPEYQPIRGKNAALAKIRVAGTQGRQHLSSRPIPTARVRRWRGIWPWCSRASARRCADSRSTRYAARRDRGDAASAELDMNLVNAQQARRVLIWLVGYKVSPFVRTTVKYGLSAGRVQSVALRLICDREALIRAFVPEEYWTIEVD